MAWPYDAKYVIAAAGAMIPSALANAEQDRIVDLHRERYLISTVAFSVEYLDKPPASAQDYFGWFLNGAAGHYFWTCRDAASRLVFPILIPNIDVNGAVVREVEVKCYSTAASTMTSILYTSDLNFDSPAVVPVVGTNQANDAAAGGAGTYDVMVLTPAADILLTNDLHAWVEVANATVADSTIGIRTRYYPLTATP